MDLLSAFLSAVITGSKAGPALGPSPTPNAASVIVADDSGTLVADGALGGGMGAAAAPPPQSLWVVQTPYGQLGCLQRARNALYSVGATGVSDNGRTVFGTYSATSAMIWCRSEGFAIVAAAGPQAQQLAETLKASF